MPPAKPAKKTATGAPGVKVLITAASLAATLGGWALLSAAEAKPAPAPVSDQATASTAVTIQLAPQLAPLPTLVPLAARTQPVPINQPRPAVNIAQPQTAPQPAANGIVLRDVSAPALPGRSAPAPVVNTGSSR